jgi:hypothetical protein
MEALNLLHKNDFVVCCMITFKSDYIESVRILLVKSY